MKKNIILNTDGGARGNPGISGAGAIAYDELGNVLKKASKYLGEKTNNFAEYSAVILGLEMLAKYFGKNKCKDINLTVKMDSELVCKQLNGEYQIKEETLFPLYIKIHNLLVSTFPNVKFEHVPRAENKDADALANEAMDSLN
jgi:ribonuclease HI